MKNSICIRLFAVLLMLNTGCKQKEDALHDDKTGNTEESRDSLLIQSESSASNNNYEYQDQRELNELHANWMIEYNDSIEQEFLLLISALPQYKEQLNKEKNAWSNYQDVLRIVANCENHGSSISMYVDDVLNQGIRLREASFHHLLQHIRGEDATFCKTTFTSSMINNAYALFIKAIGEDEYIENKKKYQDALRKEQRCWGEWMKVRKEISNSLDKDSRSYYDECTNMMLRTKLLQLKNQNRALGMFGHEEAECVLSEDCSDKELVEYPGFNVVWANH